MRIWLLLAALNGFLAVAAGAIGSHILRARESGAAGDLAVFETAVRYHMWHALALLAIAWLASIEPGRTMIPIAGWSFIAGIILFCGTLYLIGATGSRALAGLAPIGGVAFLAGWAALAAVAWQMR